MAKVSDLHRQWMKNKEYRKAHQALARLKAKLQRGATQAEGGELLDGDQIFDELREMIDKPRTS